MPGDDQDTPSLVVETAPVEKKTTITTATGSEWKFLQDAMKDADDYRHPKVGLIKTTAGAFAGGLLGLVLFKSGGGWRSASIAAGVGVGLGSHLQRSYGPFNWSTKW